MELFLSCRDVRISICSSTAREERKQFAVLFLMKGMIYSNIIAKWNKQMAIQYPSKGSNLVVRDRTCACGWRSSRSHKSTERC